MSLKYGQFKTRAKSLNLNYEKWKGYDLRDPDCFNIETIWWL